MSKRLGGMISCKDTKICLDGTEPERELTGRDVFPERSLKGWRMWERSPPKKLPVRSNTGETSMAPNPRKNSRGGRISREKYSGETSPTKIEILAEMVERLFMQESLCSLPGSVPSGPQDGLIGKPLCQEDTCHRSEHTTSHQKQSRISELNRISDDKKLY